MIGFFMFMVYGYLRDKAGKISGVCTQFWLGGNRERYLPLWQKLYLVKI